jgi:pimeloyl-ACP methyl ester carboxylesterase
MRINAIELYVAPASGDGDPLVLVHGAWTDHTTWNALVEPLARSFRVIRYDRRGHSRSARGPVDPSRRRHEDDLAVLLESVGPAHLVGTSYGAAIALALAGRRPELVRSVVAHEPPLLGLVPMPEIDALFQSVARRIEAGDAAAATEYFFEAAVLGRGGWERVPEPVRHAAIGNAQTFVDMLADRRWAALDVTAFARFGGPVLVTYGDAGPRWLPRVAVSVADRLGRPKALIPGAGHTPHHTHPDAFAAVIRAFAGDRGSRRAA